MSVVSSMLPAYPHGGQAASAVLTLLGGPAPARPVRRLVQRWAELFARFMDARSAQQLVVIQIRVLRTKYVEWLGVKANVLVPVERQMEAGSLERAFIAVLGLQGTRQAWDSMAPDHEPLAVPFELVRVAWVDGRGGTPRLHVHLDADLIYDGKGWLLRLPGSGDRTARW